MYHRGHNVHLFCLFSSFRLEDPIKNKNNIMIYLLINHKILSYNGYL